MCGVQVLQNKHSIVTLEIVKDHDDTSLIAILVNREGVKMIEEVIRASRTIKAVGFILLLVFAANQNGCLNSIVVGDGFIVRINEERG